MRKRHLILTAAATTAAASIVMPSANAASPAPAGAQSAPPVAAAAPAAVKALDLSAGGRLRLTLTGGLKFRLYVDGVPVITESHLYLVKPGWTGSYLNTDDLTPALTQFTEGDAKVGTAEYKTPQGYARFRFELRPDDTLTVKAAFAIAGDAPGEVEYGTYLDANVLAGGDFAANTVDGPRAGRVAAIAKSASQQESRVTPGLLHDAAIDTPLGRMTVTASEGNSPATAAVNLFDARKQTADWATHQPIFWLGVGSPSLAVAPGENRLTLRYAFGPSPRKPTVTAAATAKGTPVVRAVGDARVPYSAPLPLVPRPKEMSSLTGAKALRLKEKPRVILPADPTPEEKQGAAEIVADLKEVWGMTGAAVAPAGSAARPGDIVFARTAPAGVSLPDQAEGYVLRVGADGAVLVGRDARGAYYAAQTLKQLVRLDEKGVYLTPVTVRDWPTLGWRGVHWFGGPKSFAFHDAMIGRIVAPLKYNRMVFEIDYTEWESQPKTWSAESSTSKADVRRTVADARAHFLEPIPLVNVFGHMEWLFHNGQNLDIAMDPAHPYAVDPEKPRTYDVLFPILDEAVALFHPKTLHIGLDEVSMEGVFPRPGSAKTETDLFVAHTKAIHDHLAAKGVGTMMWGDMLLTAAEANNCAGNAKSDADALARRAGLPKDIVIADWHYWGGVYPSTNVLKKDGFQTVASTFYSPDNIHDFAGAAAKDGSLGLLQTTWSGYAMSMDLVKNTGSLPQFVAYLMAAEQAWNGGANADYAALGYEPSDAFLTYWNRVPADRKRHAGFTVDLAPLANAALYDWSPRTAAAPAAAPASAAFPAGSVQMAGTRFQIGRPVWLAGALNPSGAWPKSVTVPLAGRKAAALEWLWGATLAAPVETKVAAVTVTYADGTKAETPLVYGRQIRAFTDGRSTTEATVRATGAAPTGERALLRSWRWQNPKPTVPLASVTLTSENTEAAPVLLALTGIE